MKKTILILATIALIGFNNISTAQSPNWAWAKSVGNTSSDQGRSVATDASGNIFMTGYFAGSTITFGTTTLTSAGSGDVFIVKYDANGNVLWSKSVGSISDDSGYSVATDTSGNVFISGYFKGFSITFGTITLANVNQSFIFTKENFIAKYNAAGNFLWARSASGTSDDYGRGITTDTAGNAYIIGDFFSPTITFESTTLTKAGPLSQDIFMVKYDPSGNVDWAESAGNIGNESGLGIATDTNNNIYLTGSFSAPSITFGINTLTNVGNIDVFIAKVDSAILSTGIEQQTDYSSIVIAPNPFTSQTTISFKEEQQNTTIKVIDMLGKEIKSINFNGKKFILEKGEMQQGIYVVHAMDENKKVMSRKIIIR